MLLDKNQLIASICKDSFFEFVQEFWSELIAEKPVWNWHIKFLCDELQRAAERVFENKPKLHDLIINVPPGTTKSTICSIMFPAWALTRMPSARCICASHTESLVYDLSNKSRMIVFSEKYRLAFPYIKIRDDQNTKGYWMTEQGGFRFSCTVGGKNPMGFHAHFLIVDDPIDPEKVFSEAELENANNFMTLTLPSRTVSAEVSVQLLIMQRLHQNDPTGNRKSNKDLGPVKHVCLPAELTNDVTPRYLRSRYKDGLLDPIRLPRRILEQKKAMGQFGYAGQYLQSPIPLGGGMFNVAKLNFGSPPRRFKRLVRYWDKAGTKDAGAFTVGVKMGQDHDDNVWVLHVERGQWAAFEREAIIKNCAVMDGRECTIGLEQEPGSGGKESAENSARRLLGYRVKLDKVTGDKKVRAEPFAAAVGAGIVYLPQGAEWVRDYIEELRFFFYGKYKDQVDSSSGCFNMLTKPLLRAGAL
jgi:predicted phage terminase large subunit-like protein